MFSVMPKPPAAFSSVGDAKVDPVALPEPRNQVRGRLSAGPAVDIAHKQDIQMDTCEKQSTIGSAQTAARKIAYRFEKCR